MNNLFRTCSVIGVVTSEESSHLTQNWERIHYNNCCAICLIHCKQRSWHLQTDFYILNLYGRNLGKLYNWKNFPFLKYQIIVQRLTTNPWASPFPARQKASSCVCFVSTSKEFYRGGEADKQVECLYTNLSHPNHEPVAVS